MASKKTNKSKSRENWKKYAFIGVVGIVLVAVFSYVGYQSYLNKADADRFAALQSDFKKLQTEFNKIDQGWEYEEDCVAPHFVFNEGQPSCQVEIRNKNRIQGKDTEYIRLSQELVGHINDASSQNTATHKSLARKGFDSVGKSYCALELGHESYVRCVGESKKFYFLRTDQ